MSKEPTSVEPAGNFESRHPKCLGWSLESFDCGFRVGRQVKLGELHICLTESGEGSDPLPQDGFELPSPVLRFLLTGDLPEVTT